MSNSFMAERKLPTSTDSKPSGRRFLISMKGIPKVDAKTMERLEAAARNADSTKRDFPTLNVES